MTEENHSYIAIDLKSFYASVECVERGLDPLDANLVVADDTRTEKTICLAVSPSLKAYKIPGRARLFEVVEKVKEANRLRRENAPGHKFTGTSVFASELERSPELEIAYVTAPPRMAHYIGCSTKIYNIYLNYVAPEDIHVYSIDEVFMDVTHYLRTYRMTARELAAKIMQDVFSQTGITATAGIGTNLYLCKAAMDIVAKHVEPDQNGVRIAELDEGSYRRLLWDHRPLTDFWRVGRGYRRKLEENGLYTMGDIARCSLGGANDFYNEELLYKLFGVNAELLIDHAWGWEPVAMEHIKAYKPESSSMNSGQVLKCPYDFEKAKLVVWEMADMLALDLVDKGLVTDQIVLTVGYDVENLQDLKRAKAYKGETTTDHYGRKVPKHGHGTKNLGRMTSSSRIITKAVQELYEDIVNPALLIRRLYLSVNHLTEERLAKDPDTFEQLELFTDYEALAESRAKEREELSKERRLQEAMLTVKKKYGKNAMLKGTSLTEGATAQERNGQIGGHKA